MASKSGSIVALRFSVLILCLQGTYAYRIGGDASASASASAEAASATASASVLIVALMFSVPIICFQSIYAYRIGRDASASASGPIEGGFGNGNRDSQGYGDDEERTAAPRRTIWTISLHKKFLEAIAHIGLDNATPTGILKFMKEPGLTARRVGSHLQKYRIHLKAKEAAAGDEDKLDRLSRSSFARERLSRSDGSTFQVQPSAGIGSTLPLTAAASNCHGFIQFSNDQQSSTSNSSRSIPRQQPTLGNRNWDQLFFQEPSNNFENGGMSFDPMNNVGLTNNNTGTNNLMQVYPLQSQPGTNNPFSHNLATSVNQNGWNFTPMSSSFDNLGSHFNDVNQFGVYWRSSCSAGFETGASSANQFPPNLPDNNGDLDQQQNVPVLPPPEGNFNDQCGLPNISVGGGNVENSNRHLHDNFMMPAYLFTDGQDNYQPPPQQQDGGHDQGQLPYQFEVQDPAANQVPNPSADQVPNPGPYHVEDNHETILEPGVPTVFESEDLNICLHTCQNIYGMLIRNWY
ncbi:PREDICTED: putative two-component response regulator ARR21 [Prunus mume]|uniref:Two-component response regulator ARR21 n=1 Tax=Prunus mume TaxID=102107 RepID=A0ABM0PPJ5_PRUMU|nr:PREDICTED: putative two-component response regulator ARR21 [Prunus mume]